MEPDSKSPWASRGVWGGIIALVAAILGAFGYAVGEADQAALVEIGVAVAGAVGGIMAIVGRVRATKQIK